MTRKELKKLKASATTWKKPVILPVSEKDIPKPVAKKVTPPVHVASPPPAQVVTKKDSCAPSKLF